MTISRKTVRILWYTALMLCFAASGPLRAAAAPELHTSASEMKTTYPDAVGWLQVPGTDIDDVVMYRDDGNNSYYFRRDMEGNYSFEGCYYADFRCDFTSGALSRNTVIYGHSFSDDPDGTRFGRLLRYRNADFAAEHRNIYFATTERTMTWQVFAVSLMDSDTPYNAPNPTNDEFASTLKQVREKSLWGNSDIDVGPDDRILTLVAPDFSTGSFPNEFRFVITAILVDDGGESKSFSLAANINPSTGV